jgi:RadC-like JAB domain-containing protein
MPRTGSYKRRFPMHRSRAKKNPCGCNACQNPDDEGVIIESVQVTPGEPAEPGTCINWVRLEKVPQEYEACMAGLGKFGKIQSSRDTYAVLRDWYARQDQEVGVVLLLDVQLGVRGAAEVSRGDRSGTIVPVADILRVALVDGADAVIFCHNHPTGHSTPSDDDKASTVALARACGEIGLLLMDHVVFGADEFFSFADSGLLSSDLVVPAEDAPDPEVVPGLPADERQPEPAPWVDNPRAYAVGDVVTLPVGTRVGMGHLKADVRARIDQIQTSSDGSPFYGVRWTDGKGKDRFTWWAPDVPSGVRENPAEKAGEYHTQSGQVGATIKRWTGRDGRVTYSWIGKWGAGSGLSYADMRREVDSWIEHRRGIKVVVPFVAENPQVEDRSSGARLGWEHRRERDEAVVANLDPALVPLWTRMSGQFRGTPEQRYDAFMQYVHDHPGEENEALQAGADEWLEQEIRAGRARENPVVSPAERAVLAVYGWPGFHADQAACEAALAGGYLAVRRAVPGTAESRDRYVLTDRGSEVVVKHRLASRARENPLSMGPGVVDAPVTAQLQRPGFKLSAKNRGDLNSAVISAAYYAKKLGKTMYVYSGNSFGHAVWRVSYKPGEYLNLISNTGGRVASVTPDLVLSWHALDR